MIKAYPIREQAFAEAEDIKDVLQKIVASDNARDLAADGIVGFVFIEDPSEGGIKTFYTQIVKTDVCRSLLL